MLKRFREVLVRSYRKRLPEGLRLAVRQLLDEIKVERTVRRARPQFRALHEQQDLRVHLGCGPDIKEGWINIDLANSPPLFCKTSPGTRFINYDLRRGLPLADRSCKIIYSAHFFEHLKYADALRLLRDCHRTLKPRGVFRACLPNFRGMFDAYLREDRDYMNLIKIHDVLPEIEAGTETFVDHVNYGVYQAGQHKWIMDAEKMIVLLRHIGFNRVMETQFDPAMDQDIELRRRYSFYIEATK